MCFVPAWPIVLEQVEELWFQRQLPKVNVRIVFSSPLFFIGPSASCSDWLELKCPSSEVCPILRDDVVSDRRWLPVVCQSSSGLEMKQIINRNMSSPYAVQQKEERGQKTSSSHYFNLWRYSLKMAFNYILLILLIFLAVFVCISVLYQNMFENDAWPWVPLRAFL